MKTLTALLLAWISQAFLLRAEPVYEILGSFAYDYPPRAPLAALAMGPDGAYWGSTNGGGKLTCGTIFKINPVSGFRTTVLEFTGAGIDSNGLRKRGTAPAAALVNDGLGNLWGTTSGGGTEGAGTVYKFNVATGTLTTVIDFTRNGFVNKGESPNSKLVRDGAGNFWGTTSGGGGAGGGTIYKINALTNALTTVTEFNNLGDTSGSNPHGGVTDDGSGFFWGATVGGGANNAGTIFKIAANSGQFTTVLSFTGNGASNKGSFPYAMLLNDGGGNLWGTTVLGGAANMGTIFKVNIASGTLTTVIHFTGDGPSDKGARPYSGLAADASGFLWGTTSDSGANSHGTLFKLNPTTGILETVVDFTGSGPTNKGSLPLSPLVSDGAGSLLGVTGAGGVNDLGTVFKLNAASGMLVTLAEFTGSNPAGADPDFLSSAFLEATDGSLWAVKRRFRTDDSGGVYKLNSTNGAITGVAQFPHSGDSINDPIPYSGLARDGSGFFWGTSHIGGEALRGMVYKVNETTGVLTTVVSFGGHDMTAPNRGGAPVAKLVGDGAGFLWGATSNGGAGNFGTIFKINSATGAHTTVIELTGNSAMNKGATPQTALTSDGAGNLWGTTFAGGEFDTGTIFKLNITTGQLTTVVQFTSSIPNSGGAYPQSGLTGDGLGFLWGTTSAGGALDYGTVFKINIATGVLSTVAELTGNGAINKGAFPQGGLTPDGSGFLWGTTNAGGALDFGTVYKVKIATGEFSTVLEFTSAGAINRGAFPAAALTSDGAGFLWGTTNNGGAGDFGTVFKVNTTTGSLTTVQEFTSNGASTKGAYPQGSLVGDGAGSFYGTTSSGGPLDLGTVFKVNIGTGALTTMAEFSGNGATNKGNTPQAGLFNNGAGLFWGVTSGGGATGNGTVFMLDATSGVLTTMIEFNGAGPIIEGEGPFGGLASDGAGNFWGTTGTGGALNQGTVFKVNAATGVLTTVLDFTGDIAPARGSQPMARLTSDGAGYFWGTTNSGGANGFGTVFKLNASTVALTTLVEFTGSGGTHRGAGPFSELVSDGLGYFWGTTYSGGIGYGTVFKINASTGAFTTVFEFDFTTGSAPKSGLVRDDAGDLWGTTSGGGNSGDGTIYTINPTTGATSTFMHFSGIGYQRSSGGNPGFATLYRRSDGGLYGSTERGGPGAGGTVFRLRFALSPIEQWKLAQLGDALSPDSEDPDGDGMSTLAEYALLKLPGIPDGASLIASRANYAEGERLRVFVPRDPARHDVAVVVEGAGSPAGPWRPLATSTLGSPFTGPGYFGGDSATSGLKTVEVRDTVNITAAPRRFIRMRVLH